MCVSQSPILKIFFQGSIAPEPPYIIRAFGFVSPVTLVVNVQLQKDSIPRQKVLRLTSTLYINRQEKCILLQTCEHI